LENDNKRLKLEEERLRLEEKRMDAQLELQKQHGQLLQLLVSMQEDKN
jgi:hypothetical protein